MRQVCNGKCVGDKNFIIENMCWGVTFSECSAACNLLKGCFKVFFILQKIVLTDLNTWDKHCTIIDFDQLNYWSRLLIMLSTINVCISITYTYYTQTYTCTTHVRIYAHMQIVHLFANNVGVAYICLNIKTQFVLVIRKPDFLFCNICSPDCMFLLSL